MLGSHICYKNPFSAWKISDYDILPFISISSSIAVLGTAPIPAAAPIMVQSIVLQLIGIPMADIQLLVAVDWFV